MSEKCNVFRTYQFVCLVLLLKTRKLIFKQPGHPWVLSHVQLADATPLCLIIAVRVETAFER